jgi:hypothetical protein
MDASVAIKLVGCRHNGPDDTTHSPIAWQFVDGGAVFWGSGVRTAELTNNTYREVYLWLPSRTRSGAAGFTKVHITTKGTGVGGVLTFPTYEIYWNCVPAPTPANGTFDLPGGTGALVSGTITDGHTSGNWATSEVVTTIPWTGADFSTVDTQGLAHCVLKIMAPYGTGGGRGMYIKGLAVEGW